MNDVQTRELKKRRPLKVGLILPDTEREMGGETPRWKDLAAMARFGEDAGFDSLWVFDHLLYRYEGMEPQGPWNAGPIWQRWPRSHRRSKSGQSSVVPRFATLLCSRRSPIRSRSISGGRLILGLGAGWNAPDYTGFGFPFDHRISRFEQALTIIHGLLRTSRIDFEGSYYAARDCELRPRGPRPEGPPILIGSSAPRMLGLLAKYGDMWNAWGLQTVEEIIEHRDKVDAAMIAADRDPQPRSNAQSRSCSICRPPPDGQVSRTSSGLRHVLPRRSPSISSRMPKPESAMSSLCSTRIHSPAWSGQRRHLSTWIAAEGYRNGAR